MRCFAGCSIARQSAPLSGIGMEVNCELETISPGNSCGPARGGSNGRLSFLLDSALHQPQAGKACFKRNPGNSCRSHRFQIGGIAAEMSALLTSRVAQCSSSDRECATPHVSTLPIQLSNAD